MSDFASECVAGDSFDRGKPRRKVVRSASTASRTCCQRKEVEKVQRLGGGGERQLEKQLERERELRKRQAAEHEAEMENLYRQLSNVL